MIRRLAIFILAAASCWFIFAHFLDTRREARRWRETQKAGGVPRFWTSETSIAQTLMNPPGMKGAKQTDSHGFAEDTEVTRAGTNRWFCLGDSVTYGLLPNNECFPALLHAVNAGRGGESTYTALLRYRYVVSTYENKGVIVGWFAGNEPVEMTREGVYNGPRVRRDATGWSVLWEDDTQLGHVDSADVASAFSDLKSMLAPRVRALRERRSDKIDYLKEGSSQDGTLSKRYALYGGTAFISAFYFLRYDGSEETFWSNLEDFTARTLAVARGFRQSTGGKLVYVAIPEACEIEMDRVRANPEFEGLLRTLELEESDLTVAGDLRAWFMRVLAKEGVRCADPRLEMQKLAASQPVFRKSDLHPTLAGNRALATAIGVLLD